eukprot:1871234-Karenia_brevis.AAC.1
MVARTSVDDGQLRIDFGATWEDYLSEGNLEEIYGRAQSSLQRSLTARSKGKAKGKGKGKTKSTQVFGIDAEDY